MLGRMRSGGSVSSGLEKLAPGEEHSGELIIHAGQFMSTRVHDADEEETDEEAEIDVVTSDSQESEKDPITGRDQPHIPTVPPTSEKEEKPVTFYKFGPKNTKSIAIDVSLGKLNKCINFAYKRLTTPRWKFFHGLKLSWKERVRLNNVIWRSWHMEFVGRQHPKYCCYSVPAEDTHHQHSEAAVLEGMYWKRRLDAVCAQYKRWRVQGVHRDAGVVHRKRRRPSGKPDPAVPIYVPHPPPAKTVIGSSADTDTILGAGGSFFDKDDLDNCFTDRLFDSLNSTSYMFPDPRDISAGAHSKNADIIQPSLLTLQPSLEDIMASLDATYEEGDLFNEDSNEFLFPAPYSRPKEKEPRPGTSTDKVGYTSKDYEDAQLLLPPPPPRQGMPALYNPIGHGLTYSQAPVSADLDFGPPMGPPNPPSQFLPTPSKGALKAFPGIPPHQEPPKVRAKRAKQRAREEELQRLEMEKRTSRQHQYIPIQGPSGQGILNQNSAFTPVSSIQPPFIGFPQRPSPLSPPMHRIQPQTSIMSLIQPTGASSFFVVAPPVSPASSSTPSPLPILPSLQPKSEPGEAPKPRKGTKRAAADSTMDPSERKRMLHLHAEQSRRSALKTGFDQLEALLPNLSPGAKNTNAAILARGSEHIGQLKQRVESDRAELRGVEARVRLLNERIRSLQSSMPTSVGGSGGSLAALGTAFARRRTAEEPKFPLLWRLSAKLFASFAADVDGADPAQLAASARDWAATHCDVAQLRPEMSSMLVELVTEAPAILSDPSQIPDALQRRFL